MLSLMEEMILIGLNDEKGKIGGNASFTLGQGLAGAILLDLSLRNKIKVEEKILSVSDSEPTGDELLDKALEQIQTSKKPRAIDYWLMKFNALALKNRSLIYARLKEEKIVREEEKCILIFFHIKRHPLRNKKVKREILERLRAVVFRRRTPEGRTQCLLNLVQSCNWQHLVFEKDRLKEAKKKLKEILEKNAIAEGVTKATQAAIQAQITAAVMAGILTATNAANH